MSREIVCLQAFLFAPHVDVATYKHLEVLLRRDSVVEQSLYRTAGGCKELKRHTLPLKFSFPSCCFQREALGCIRWWEEIYPSVVTPFWVHVKMNASRKYSEISLLFEPRCLSPGIGEECGFVLNSV